MRFVQVRRAASNWFAVSGRVTYALSALWTYQRDDLCRLSVQPVRQLFIVRDDVGDIDIAVVLLDQCVFSDLVSVFRSSDLCDLKQLCSRLPVDEDAVQLELEDEVDELSLDLRSRLLQDIAVVISLGTVDAERVRRLSVHLVGRPFYCCKRLNEGQSGGFAHSDGGWISRETRVDASRREST